MGRVALIARLVASDLRRQPGSAALLLLVITAATTTLTLGLALAPRSRVPTSSRRARRSAATTAA